MSVCRYHLLWFLLWISVFTHIDALSHDDALKIGIKVWHNEGQGYEHNLLTWNQGEQFLSLGLGHFIWTPPHVQHRYGHSFIELLQFFEQSGVELPDWLRHEHHPQCPWRNRNAFLADHGVKKQQLQALLRQTIPLQINFIVDRFRAVKPKLLKRLAKKDQQKSIQRLKGLLESDQGIYVLVDYLNFKGQGLSHNPDGWGLLQVIEQMARAPDSLSDIEAFVWAADVVLEARAQHDPSARQWQLGWKNRVYGYLN